MARHPLNSFLLVLTTVALLQSCSKKNNVPDPVTGVPLQISSFAPAGGAKGTTVTITGTGFNAIPANNVVTFNGIAATVSAATATSLTIITPVAAGVGKVSVTVSGVSAGSANDFNFIYTASTFAGSGSYGFADGSGAAAKFSNPYGLATDAAGNVYVADSDNNRIRKITPAGVVSTIAGDGTIGSANGPATTAQFNYPHGLVLDAEGNIYVADAGNNRIRKITTAGVVSTIAGNGNPGLVNGAGATAEFSFPCALVLDGAGNLFVTDGNNKCIRKITPTGMVSTFTAAVFGFPEGIAIDAGGTLYVADPGSSLIRKVTPAGAVSTFAGTGSAGFTDGPGTVAQFFVNEGIATDAAGNLYVSDLSNNAIRKVTPTGMVSTIAGNGVNGFADGPGPDARFHNPSAIAVDAAGNIYVGDESNSRIRKLQ